MPGGASGRPDCAFHAVPPEPRRPGCGEVIGSKDLAPRVRHLASERWKVGAAEGGGLHVVEQSERPPVRLRGGDRAAAGQ